VGAKKHKKDRKVMYPKGLDREGLVAYGEHLLGARREALCLTATGRVYLPAIEGDVKYLQAHGPEEESDAEAILVAEMRAHSASGRAIALELEAIAAEPEFGPEIQAAAQRILDAFGPKPSPRMTAASRVKRASVLRQDMAGLGAEVGLLPTSIGGSRYGDRIERWCARGTAFAASVEQGAEARESAASSTEGHQIAQVVTRLNSVLGRARVAIRDEIALNAALPRGLETQLFGLYDQLLEERRAPAPRKPKKEPEAAAPQPEPASPEPASPEPA
jgi:hypothetical protein